MPCCTSCNGGPYDSEILNRGRCPSCADAEEWLAKENQRKWLFTYEETGETAGPLTRVELDELLTDPRVKGVALEVVRHISSPK